MRPVFSSLAFKICLIIVIMETIVLAGLGFYYISQFNEEVEKRVYTKMKIPGKLMTEGTLSYDAAEDRHVLTELVGEHILQSMVVRRDGVIFYASDPEIEGKQADEVLIGEITKHLRTDLKSDAFVQLESEYNQLTAVSPIFNKDNLLGFLFLKADILKANMEKRSIALRFIVTSLLCIFVTSLIEILLLHYEIIPRIKKSVECLRTIEKGDLTARIDNIRSGDELGELQKGINTMIGQLEKDNLAVQNRLQQAQKMEAIGLMAGGVAHDLNNILSAIVGYPELILYDLPADSPLRKPIEAINDSGKRAAAVVADLLTVARGAATAKTECDLHASIYEYLSSPECLELKSLYGHVTFQHHCEAFQTTILASKVHVKKCLMNLVTNAAESIDGGEGSIVISTRNESVGAAISSALTLAEGEYVVLSVEDDGPGISSDDLEHIYEPFYSKKVMGRSGTGLGLTVVWNTMEDHKGRVIVESGDKGTCFQLYFPITDASIASQSEKGDLDFTGNGEFILVVDDERHLRDLASQMLKRLGYKVAALPSGEEAIEFVKESRVDLLVLDMLMEPGINGYQTYKKIISLYPGQKAIIASGFSESTDVKKALKLGAGKFIKKPYSTQDLGLAVKEVLRS